MSAPASGLPHPALAAIRRVLDGWQSSLDGCGLCDADIEVEGHRHVTDLESGAIQCVCQACHNLFTPAGSGGGRWRAIPDRWLEIDDARNLLHQLDIPVAVAFVVIDARLGRPRVSYPGIAGVVASDLPLDTWDLVVVDHPEVASLEPEVEALLVRSRAGHDEAYLVPVDACYELAGRMRGRMTTASVGPHGDDELDALFARVRSRVARATCGR